MKVWYDWALMKNINVLCLLTFFFPFLWMIGKMETIKQDRGHPANSIFIMYMGGSRLMLNRDPVDRQLFVLGVGDMVAVWSWSMSYKSLQAHVGGKFCFEIERESVEWNHPEWLNHGHSFHLRCGAWVSLLESNPFDLEKSRIKSHF